MPVTAAPRFSTALLASAFVLGTAVLAQDPGGLVTGSFGDQPLELPVSADLSAATMIDDYADASLAAALTEGDQGPLFLTMTLSGELPDPGEVMLELAFARDMGRNWQGDQNSLTLELGGFAPSDGMVHLFGTITGEVTGGPASETRAVTFSFDAYLEQVEWDAETISGNDPFVRPRRRRARRWRL